LSSRPTPPTRTSSSGASTSAAGTVAERRESCAAGRLEHDDRPTVCHDPPPSKHKSDSPAAFAADARGWGISSSDPLLLEASTSGATAGTLIHRALHALSANQARQLARHNIARARERGVRAARP
jgi:hypothetical protein